jgi:hypothetical protein
VPNSANVPHAVSTSCRPLDILSTVNQITKRMVTCSAHYQAVLHRVVAEHHACLASMLHSSLLNGLKHVLSFNGMPSFHHSAAPLLYKPKDQQHMRQNAEKARRLLDDMRCLLDAYLWSSEQISMFLGQMLSDDPLAGQAEAARRYSVSHKCREGGRCWIMDMTEAWPHTRKHLVESFCSRARLQGALPFYRVWAASPVHHHVLSQYLRIKNRTSNLRRRIWIAWERLVGVCRSIKKVLRTHLLLHQRVTCRAAFRAWQHAVFFMRAGARQQRTAVLHSAFHQWLLHACTCRIRGESCHCRTLARGPDAL